MFKPHAASTRKLILEMGSDQLVDYVMELYKKHGSIKAMVLHNDPYMPLLQQCYTELTGKELLDNISPIFTKELEKFRSEL